MALLSVIRRWHFREGMVDGKETAVALIDAPQALTLRQEPKANVARYDTLRGKDVRHAS